MEDKLDQKIQEWKSLLLDTSNRSKLINFREGQRSTVEIISPGIDELYEKIVIKEKKLKFPYLKQTESQDVNNAQTNIFTIIDTQQVESEVKIVKGDFEVCTKGKNDKLTIKELQKTLRYSGTWI